MASFSSGISLLSPHITWEIWSPRQYFQQFHDVPGEFAAKICQLFANLNPKPSAFRSALQLAELHFSHLLSVLYRMCYCTPLTEQEHHFMATQSTNHSTSHQLLCTKSTEAAMENHFGLGIFSHSSEELVVQAAAWLQQWQIVKGRSLQDGNCMFKSQSVFHKHPY